MPQNIYIVSAKRTAFGAFGGALKGFTANVLGGHAAKAALESAAPGRQLPVDHVVFGNVAQTSSDAAYLARHVALRANLPISTPALTVNRLCGSGFQAVVNAAQEILAGDANIVLAGGTENMSQSPFAARNIRWGVKYPESPVLEDTLANSLVDQYPTQTPMGITAENLAQKYGITRQQVDDFALTSQKRWAAAQEAGIFNSEIFPISLGLNKSGTEEFFKVDEHARPKTTIEGLAKLKPVFKKDGVTTAGNASGISDGAAALVVASESAVKAHGLKPLARIVSWHYEGVEPHIMGIGPVPAIKGALKKAKLSLDQIGLVEVNEAFGAQFLAVEKELGLDRNKTNLNGGAIALGHPLAASGARILAHLVHELQRKKIDHAVGSACIGGGQGIAVVLERV